MTIIVCLDNKNGLLFNNRRVSRDSKIFEDIKSYLQGNLFATAFSEKLLSSSGLPYCIVDNFKDADSNSFIFLENQSMKELVNQADTLIVYWWNRDYPSDFKLDINLAEQGYISQEITDFKGSSHEKITKEIFRK